MTPQKQIMWGIGAGIVLVIFGFVLPTLHGVMEFYLDKGEYLSLRDLSLFTGVVVTPITSLSVYLYGTGLRGIGRKVNSIHAKKAGWGFFGEAMGHLIFSLTTINFGLAAGKVASSGDELLLHTPGFLKGMSSFIPGTFAGIGCYYMYRHFSETKEEYGKMGSLMIVGGIFLSIIAKTLLFYRYPSYWFEMWEIGHGIKSAGIVLTIYSLFRQYKNSSTGATLTAFIEE